MGNGSFIPNSTQVNNVVLDVLLPFMREGERAVFLYIFRRTFGFNRHEDSIGLDQFEHGLVTREGKRLDYGCGMKRRVIIQALGFLMSAGIIERLEGGLGRTHISRYRMNVKDCPIIQQLEEMQERNATPEQIAQILHHFRKVADSAPNERSKSIDSDTYHNDADNAPLLNSADSAPNEPIKGAENDPEKVQKSNPQSIRENQTTEIQKERDIEMSEIDPGADKDFLIETLTGVISEMPPASKKSAQLFHYTLAALLEEMGWRLKKEFMVEEQANGRRGFCDILVTYPAPLAIELDRVSPRMKSIMKLKEVSATRVIVLRESTEWTNSIEGIDAVLCAGVKKPLGKQKIPEHPIPPDYQPSEITRRDIPIKYPGAKVDRLVDAMQNWARSKGVCRSDWDATLRTFAARDWKERGAPESAQRITKFVE